MQLRHILTGLLFGLVLLLTGTQAFAKPLNSTDQQHFSDLFAQQGWYSYDYGEYYAQNESNLMYYNGEGSGFLIGSGAAWDYTDTDSFAFWLNRQRNECIIWATLYSSSDPYMAMYYSGRAQGFLIAMNEVLGY